MYDSKRQANVKAQTTTILDFKLIQIVCRVRLASDNIYDEPRQYLTLKTKLTPDEMTVKVNEDYSEPQGAEYATPYSDTAVDDDSTSEKFHQPSKTDWPSLPPPPVPSQAEDRRQTPPELPPPPTWCVGKTGDKGYDNISYYEPVAISDKYHPEQKSSVNPLYAGIPERSINALYT